MRDLIFLENLKGKLFRGKDVSSLIESMSYVFFKFTENATTGNDDRFVNRTNVLCFFKFIKNAIAVPSDILRQF